jgi:glycosyltransferase involved in cell wall biosynthesis
VPLSTTAVIIPTYNESENLEQLVGMILALPLEPHIIVVDDNSPDGTGQIADRLAAEEGRVQTGAGNCVHCGLSMGPLSRGGIYPHHGCRLLPSPALYTLPGGQG